MSKISFLSFQYEISRKSSVKHWQQPSFAKPQRQVSNVSRPDQSINAEEMKWVFDKLDTNKDGKSWQAEYKAALKLLGKGGVGSMTDRAKSFRAIDTDDDGFIDLKELMGMDEQH